MFVGAACNSIPSYEITVASSPGHSTPTWPKNGLTHGKTLPMPEWYNKSAIWKKKLPAYLWLYNVWQLNHAEFMIKCTVP